MNKIFSKIDFSWIGQYKKIYSGFSGGADSTALLIALAAEAEKGSFELEAVHFDHGIRGDFSKADADWCRDFCKNLSIPFCQVDLEIAPDCKNLEATARKMRLETWEKLVNNETDAVAVGQHADDRIENIFLRFMRGSNATGLTSMRSSQKVAGITFIRPLLSLRRHEIEDFLKIAGVEGWRTDHTNFENIYRRNFIRNEVLPLLRKEFTDVDKAFLKSISALELDADFLEKNSAQVFSEIKYAIEDLNNLPVEYIEDIHPAIQARVLRLWLTEILGSETIPTADFLKRLRWALEDYHNEDGRKILIPLEKGISFALEKDMLSLNPLESDNILYHTVEWDYLRKKSVEWENGVLLCEKVLIVDDKALTDPSHKSVFFAGRQLPERLVIRKRIDGDRMIPFAQYNEVKVKKLLQDTDLMSDQKKNIPIVATPEGEIIWIPGVRRANFANISDLSVDILRFTYRTGKKKKKLNVNNMVADVLIDKLIRQEELLARYYNLLQEELPEYSEIWDFLHKEEQGHIRVLQKLEPCFKNGEVYMTSELVNLKTLQYSLDFLVMKTEEIKSRKHTPLELLELGLQFEVCTLEAIVFDSIGSENLKILKQLHWIQKGTEKHATILKSAIEAYNKDHGSVIGKITGLFNPTQPFSPEED